MEAYRHAHLAHTRTSHLTKLYSDAKKSAVTSAIIQPDATAHSAALHRKFRIQKDRLITWGLAWSDDEKGPDGNIDESVAKAGLTETVASVLRNVKEVTDELEGLRSGYVKDGEKLGFPIQSSPFDGARYDDLLKDLTASIDTLYDLSRSRRALARGEHPTFSAPSVEKSEVATPTPTPKSNYTPSIAGSELTLVNPPAFSRPSLSPYAGLPPRIDSSALRLPPEGPPSYDSLGVPSTTRQIARLNRRRASITVQNALGSSADEVPVLVEYADFDSTYRATGVPPPLQRLEALAATFQPMRPDSQHNLSLLCYFEDTLQPRIGLVYDLPYSVQNQMHAAVEVEGQKVAPSSLLKILRKRKQTPTAPDVELPALEDRFRIALRLTEQLHAMHEVELAHGNVNSASVIFATTPTDTPALRQRRLRSPMWASFDLFSKCRVEGTKRAANLNIYKHPDDVSHGGSRDISLDLKYDLYGLGLLLLEIGLWHPIGDFYKPKYSITDFKKRIEQLWVPKLGERCGSPYMRAVQTCLRVVDEHETSSLTLEGVYDHVLRNLEKCCLLDDDNDSVTSANDYLSHVAAYLRTPTGRALERPRQPSPGMSAISRHKSDERELSRSSSASTLAANPLLRSQSVSAVAPTAAYRLSSLPNLAAASVPMAYAGISPTQEARADRPKSAARSVSKRQSVSEMKGQLSRKLSSSSSFQDYKRKVTLIQKRWRECHQQRQAMRQAKPDPRSLPQLTEKTVEEPLEIQDHSDRRVRAKRQEFPSLKLPQAVMEDWHNKTAMELGRLVEKALRGSPESSSVGLTLYGETPETARPTYLVCCSSTAKVKHVLKKHFNFDPNICDVRVKKCSIRRSRRSRRSGTTEKALRSMALNSDGEIDAAANPDYQPQPLCGASIGAYKDEAHLPPVSFGGIVLVDGKLYGMSVHHMLEDGEEDDLEEDADEEDAGSDTSSLASLDDVVSEDDSTARQLSLPSDISDDSDDQVSNDYPGISPGEGTDIEITQPALDDAIALDLHADEEAEGGDEDDGDSGVSEDHILSYKLGQVHASSGLKRSTFHSTEAGYSGISASLPQEIDWALFDLLPPRVHPFNVVKGGRRYCNAGEPGEKDCFPIAVQDGSALPEAKVHCLARTSGLANGVISSTMELLKLHGRTTFSASWTVHGGFGVGGDSGAWIISNDGKVCGHVLAERQGRTYICPMDLLFEDIKATLGAKQVSLPTTCDAKTGQCEKKTLSEALDGTQNDVAAVMSKLRVSEGETGGVALPSPPSSPRRHCVFSRTAEMLRSAG